MAKNTSHIDTSEIISDLIGTLTQEELVEFVKELNREVGEFDFTKELRDYFIEDVDEEEEEVEDYSDENLYN